MNVFLLAIVVPEYALQLAQGLGLQDKVEIGLLTSDGREMLADFPRLFEQARFSHCLLPHHPKVDPRRLLVAWRTYARIRAHGSEVVHFQEGRHYPETYLALRWACRRRLPLVVTVHDVAVHPGDEMPLRSYFLSIKIMELADRFIVHGQTQAALLAERLSFDERLISVVEHGNYDIYRLAAQAGPTPPPEPGRVLLFGRMVRYKGLEVLRAAARLAAARVPGLKVVLAGRGPELTRLRPELAQDPLFEIHEGFIPAAQVPSLFGRAGLVVLPYLEASQSGPLNLAFSFGRPVVASRVGAMAESVAEGREGLLVPPGDPAALAEALVKVLTDPELAARMGRAGRARAEGPLNWAGAIAEKTRAVYRAAIEDRRQGRRSATLAPAERWRRAKAALARDQAA